MRDKRLNNLVKQLIIVLGQELDIDLEMGIWLVGGVLEKEKHLGECLLEYDE